MTNNKHWLHLLPMAAYCNIIYKWEIANMEFNGKVTIATCATSRIGKSPAKVFAHEKVTIAIVDVCVFLIIHQYFSFLGAGKKTDEHPAR